MPVCQPSGGTEEAVGGGTEEAVGRVGMRYATSEVRKRKDPMKSLRGDW